MREVNNPEEAAALATVPEIERTLKLHADATERLRKHPAGVGPDVARNAAIDEAVNGFTAGGTWPADVGAKVAKAYADAQVWEAEHLTLQRAVDVTEDLAHSTRRVLSDDALAFLGTRLADILSAARKATEVLGDVQSAEDAIKVGGDAVGAWSTLSALLDDYRNVRAAQWAFLTPQRHRLDLAGVDDERSRELRQWKRDGHGHVVGFDPDNVPADVLSAMQTGRYTVAYLRWIASIGTAYVPRSRDELETEVLSTAARHDVFYDDNGPILRDLTRPTPEPAYRPSKTFAHSSTPQMDDSKPRTPAPKPNATVGDSPYVTENPQARAARSF